MKLFRKTRQNFRKMLKKCKTLRKFRANLEKFVNFIDKLRSKYQNNLRKIEEAYYFK